MSIFSSKWIVYVGGDTDRTLFQQQTYKETLYYTKKQKNQCIRESEKEKACYGISSKAR